MQINCHHPAVIGALQNSVRLIREHGGEIHPKLIVQESQGRLNVHCPLANDTETLLRIPDALFIPVSRNGWHVQNQQLIYSGDCSALSHTQRALLDDMLSIYNACHKLEQACMHLPMHALRAEPELLLWLQSAFPGFALPDPNPAQRFIETRLHETENSRNAANGDAFLMPMIDLLNHHPKAAEYQRTVQGDWRIAVQHPLPDSTECFVRYADADSLWLAVWHGYLEIHTDFVASLSCDLHHPEIDDIHIIGSPVKRRNMNVPQIISGTSELSIQNIVLEQRQLKPLHALLGLAVRSKRREMRQAQAEKIANELIYLLVKANIEKYQELNALYAEQTVTHPLRILFGQVAQHQLRLLNDLKF